MIKRLASALLVAAALTVPAVAATPAPVGPVVVAAVQADFIGERAAMNAARRAYPQAVAITARLVDGRSAFYVVRMEQGSRLFDVRVDARTGRVLN